MSPGVARKAFRSSREGRGLTSDQLLALPAAIDLDAANSGLTNGRSTGYALAEQGQDPVKVLLLGNLGNVYRVVTADLLQLLAAAWPTDGARGRE